MRYLVVTHLSDRGEYVNKVYEQGKEYTYFVADQNGIDIYKDSPNGTYQIASFDLDRLYYFKLVDPEVVFSDTGRVIVRKPDDPDRVLNEIIANKDALKLAHDMPPKRVKASKKKL